MTSGERSFVFSGNTERLDRFLARRLRPISRSRLQKLIEQGRATVNGRPALSRHLLAAGDEIRLSLPKFSSLPVSAASSVPILYEDESILVVNKPANLVVHPAGPHQKDTLVQRLWPKLAPLWSETVDSSGQDASRPGVVHRLDRGTSGVMVIAKNPDAAKNLSRQFAERSVKKIYWALVRGTPATRKGRIRSVVGRSRREPDRMSVKEQGRWSETEFDVLARYPAWEEKGAALLEVRPLTGRTHQIRVQLAALGHPVIGDRVYGSPADSSAARPLLHALSLEMAHPKTGRRVKWEAGLPPDFENFLTEFGWKKKIVRTARAESR